MNSEILKKIKKIYGEKCVDVSLRESRGLSLGFGKKIHHDNSHLRSNFFCEWELGTYYGSWRIIKNNKILLASNDDLELLKEKITQLEFGEIITITNLSPFDIRVSFSDDLNIDFLLAFSDEDEVFHIFCPEKIYITFTSEGAWMMGASDVPWSK